ncbi:MAG: T9SS type A sorting domain-containing protein [Flavobacteriales bacterium]|jgi:hypothetical protein
MKTILHLCILSFLSLGVNAQSLNLSWAKQFAGPSNQKPENSIIDNAGNIISVGFFEGITDFDPNAGSSVLSSQGVKDGYISKLNSNGEYLFAISIGSTLDDIVYDVSVDGANNIYVTGEFRGTVNFDPTGTGTGSPTTLTAFSGVNAFVAKYNPTGGLVWVRKIANNSSTGYETGRSIDADIDGNVVSTGIYYGIVDYDPGAAVAELGTTSQYGAYIQKLTTDGSYIWARVFSNYYAGPNNIVQDEAGNIFTTGIFYGAMDFDPGVGAFTLNGQYYDSYILKLNNAGNFVWAKQLSSNYYVYADDLQFDSQGNIYIVGGHNGITDFNPDLVATETLTAPSSQYRAYLLKLNSLGLFQWVKLLAPNAVSRAYHLQIDNEDNLHIAGTFQGASDFDPDPLYEFPLTGSATYTDDVFITRLDSDANFVSAHKFGGTNAESVDGFIVNPDTRLTFINGFFSSSVNFDPSGGNVSLTANGGNDAYMLRLTQCDATSFNFNESACGSYNFNGNIYTESGVYEALLTSVAGCDSLVTVDLEVFESSISDVLLTTTDVVTYNDILYTEAGNYSQTLQNVNGCDSIIYIEVFILEDGWPLSVEGEDITHNVTGQSYQWVDCNNNNAPIPGATEQSFSPTQSGNYAVIVYGNEGDAMSDCVQFTYVGITEENAANVKVYPNPFTDVITVDLEESNAQYIITDISGRRVKEGMLNQRQLSLNELSTGTYTLQVYTSLSNFALKIVKQ